MREAIKKAVKLGDQLGHIFVATADADGLPHVAASGKISVENESWVGVSEWFCPGTLSNLRDNPRMALVVWDAKNDIGFQILGACERVDEISTMGGFSTDVVNDKVLPQVERKILLRVDKIIRFSHAPHSDLEE
jgi:hypothetical protein